jgi:hypothetical protein
MCILAIISILLLGIGGVNGLEQYIEDADRFPGWKGELPNALHVDYKDSVGLVEAGKVRLRMAIDKSTVIIISLIHGECAALRLCVIRRLIVLPELVGWLDSVYLWFDTPKS